MGNPYPAKFTEKGGSVRLQGELDFTDSGNQPGGSSSAIAPVKVDTTFISPATIEAAIASGGLPTVDGYALQENDRVLAVGVTPGENQGVWVAHAATAWTRPTDYADAATIPAAASVQVLGGDDAYGTVWYLLNAASYETPITVGTSDLDFFSDASPGWWFRGSDGYLRFSGNTGVDTSGFTLRVDTVDVSGLPTSNPGPGLLWNDTGDGNRLKVGT